MYIHGKPKEPQAPVKKFELPFNFKRGEKKENPVKKFKLPFNFKRGKKKEKVERVGVRRPLKHKIPRGVRKNRAERNASQSFFDGSVSGLMAQMVMSVLTMVLAGAIALSIAFLIVRGMGTMSAPVVIIGYVITVLASCYVYCRMMRWSCSHTVISGRRQTFIGTAPDMFRQVFLWGIGWGVVVQIIYNLPVMSLPSFPPIYPVRYLIPALIVIGYAGMAIISFMKWKASNIIA